MNNQIVELLSRFAIYGDLLTIEPFGNGHINSTFVSQWNQAGTIVRYIHQRINTRVFTHPELVMKNIERVTGHIRQRLIQDGVTDVSSHVLTLVPLKTGAFWTRDEDGNFWRTYLFIEGARTQEIVGTPQEAQLLGAAIGQFQKQLSDLHGSVLHETIPHFHDMNRRYTHLDEVISADTHHRAHLVLQELSFLQDNRDRGMILTRALQTQRIPERICHNDTKLNNLLLSQDKKSVLCVTDLDTVMPGTVLFDVGDLIRTVTNQVPEDERDITKVKCHASMYESLLEGYLSEAAVFLTKGEWSLLEEAGRSMTQIMAVRFLTDYLEGDVYYHIGYPEHNLDRARNQIALMKSMDAQWDLITEITGNLRKKWAKGAEHI